MAKEHKDVLGVDSYEDGVVFETRNPKLIKILSKMDAAFRHDSGGTQEIVPLEQIGGSAESTKGPVRFIAKRVRR